MYSTLDEVQQLQLQISRKKQQENVENGKINITFPNNALIPKLFNRIYISKQKQYKILNKHQQPTTTKTMSIETPPQKDTLNSTKKSIYLPTTKKIPKKKNTDNQRQTRNSEEENRNQAFL
eukprot:TRINITY_DN10407_c0_g1_i1.p2 TRINITY_DN10407_c0_g1~~TRINITY_DN10407_c0_g1_i1.p2  ORF type:complete len:121 (+),score=5.51 TRINITY_DN10407_c0_g1_i1:803-1165(+)